MRDAALTSSLLKFPASHANIINAIDPFTQRFDPIPSQLLKNQALAHRSGAASLLIDCVELIDHLLKTDRKLEQEAIEASFCVKILQLKQLTTPDIHAND